MMREYVRVGDTEPRRSDARIIAATHRDLKAAVTDGSFRDDLFYRLNVVTIRLPALRQRREGIPSPVRSLLKPQTHSARGPTLTVSAEAMAALVAYEWPGNI